MNALVSLKINVECNLCCDQSFSKPYTDVHTHTHPPTHTPTHTYPCTCTPSTHLHKFITFCELCSYFLCSLVSFVCIFLLTLTSVVYCFVAFIYQLLFLCVNNKYGYFFSQFLIMK